MYLLAPKALHGCYFFCEPIAEGSFGLIYSAIHALTQQKVAVKIIDKKKLQVDVFRVRTEIDALKQLHHKYIYKLYQVVETDSHFYLIFEYLPGGELFDYILQEERLSEDKARVIFRQLVSAIGYSHMKGFSHRDLKPENILLDNDQNIRVIDFGLCAKHNRSELLNTFCGSFAYAAPEVLANKNYSGNAADIWSLGVILYALLCGFLPFDPNHPNELPQKISKGQYKMPEYLSKNSKHLLSKLLCVDPKKRIKMDDLRQHPWIVEGCNKPVSLVEEEKPTANLNMDIVNEIAAYTRIPRVEIARILKKGYYDYIMATYRIMETAFNEEGLFLRLHRKEAHRTLTTKAYNGNNEKPVLKDNKNLTNGRNNQYPPTSRIPPTDQTQATAAMTSDQKSLQRALSEEQLITKFKEGSISLTKYADENISPKIQKKKNVENLCKSPMSPSGRSIDSQINQLNKSNMSNNKSKMPENLKNGYGDKNSVPNVYPLDCSEGKPPLFNLDSGERLKLTVDRLRKVRAGKNVIICCESLSPNEIFAKLVDSLAKKAINYKINKSGGFHCFIMNDWGKEVLTFKLEIVRVTNSHELFTRNEPEENPSEPASSTNTNPLKMHNIFNRKKPEKTTTGSAASSNSSFSTQSSLYTAKSSKTQNQTLGVKMKRLNGEAFTYQSICRGVITDSQISRKNSLP